MTYARGHQADWNFFAEEAGDASWNYEAIVKRYQRLEDFHGLPDPRYRGLGGPVFVEPAADPHPLALAMVQGAVASGLPVFENANGRMMENPQGVSMMDLIEHEGQRRSAYRSFIYPRMEQTNLTVLPLAQVTRVLLEGKRATGVEFRYEGTTHTVRTTCEVVLCLGAIETPKILMQSGIGESKQLLRHGIGTVQHLPGVGQNFQDHVAFGCVWEAAGPIEGNDKSGSATCFACSRAELTSPDLYICLGKIPFASKEAFARFGAVESGWTMFGGVVQPKSRGTVRLTGPDADDPVLLDPNMLAEPEDMQAAVACIELCREIGNSSPLSPYRRREVMPGNLRGVELEEFIRDAALTYWHQCGTAKMGTDALSVVDHELKVYGIDRLRIADASVLPRITTGNTMAPCLVIGDKAADCLMRTHDLSTNVTA
jgi:choline dehydrogenase